MSRFSNNRIKSLSPYTPGEQPKNGERAIKLNTNESPYPPSDKAAEAAARAAKGLNLYPDPACSRLSEAMAIEVGVDKEKIILTNGSDEALYFAFLAFCDEKTPAAFPDITYGFYKVFAGLCGVEYDEIPLRADFGIEPSDYFGINRTIFIANPNAPTGLALSRKEIEGILQNNPDNIVVIDEAYVDFGGESCVELVDRYDNLLVVGTFSKSRSMAGARLGYAVGGREIIADLNRIKYSTNPYNINAMTQSAALGTLADGEYTRKNIAAVCKTREYAAAELRRLGFWVIESKANFLFAKNDKIGGDELCRELKRRGVLVRHFDAPRISEYNRITIGTPEQIGELVRQLEIILDGRV